MNSNHVLHSILSSFSTASQHCSLRPHSHSLILPDHDNHLSGCNFVTCMLYKQCYLVFDFSVLIVLVVCSQYVHLQSVSLCNKRIYIYIYQC